MKAIAIVLIPIFTLAAYMSVGFEYTTDFSEFSSGFFPFIGIGEGDFELRLGFRNFEPIWVIRLEGLYKKSIGWMFLSGAFSTMFPIGKSDFQPIYEMTASIGKDFQMYFLTTSIQGGIGIALTAFNLEATRFLSYFSLSVR